MTNSLREIVDDEPIAVFILLGLILLGSIVSLAFGLMATSCWHLLIEQRGVKLPDGVLEKTAFIVKSYPSVFWVSTAILALSCLTYFMYRLRQRRMLEYHG